MLPAKQNLLNKSRLKFQHLDPVQQILDRCQYLLPQCLTPAPAPPVAEYEHNATAKQALCLQRFPSRSVNASSILINMVLWLFQAVIWVVLYH